MGILAWIVLGLLAGLLAKFLLPGADPGGLIMTMLLGIAGAMVGGYLGHHLLGLSDISGFNLQSLATAVVGAILLLIVYRVVTKKSG